MKTNLRTDCVYRALPRGYRWATSDEVERILGYGPNLSDWIEVGVVPGMVDYGVPMHPLDAVDDEGHLVCPFCGVDIEDHDAVHYDEDCYK